MKLMKDLKIEYNNQQITDRYSMWCLLDKATSGKKCYVQTKQPLERK